MTPVRYHPAARDEIRAAIRYGEAERTGRGALREAAVSHVLRRLRRLPVSAPRWPRLSGSFEVRKAVVKRHPYLVVYAILPEQIVVLPIAHASKNAGYWRNRVAGVAR